MNVYITIGGQGTRLKTISPLDKYLLHLGDKTILEHIYDIFPTAKLVGHKKTTSRRETLAELAGQEDCLIVDCDLIPRDFQPFSTDMDTIFAFRSNKDKYCSLVLQNNRVASALERKNISSLKCSGLYFVKSVDRLLASMTDDNSIASGMVGARVIEEDTFIRVGDVEDYYEAL